MWIKLIMNIEQFSIRVYKQYFNFAASHFMTFPNGTREPLHGHNYRVELKGDALSLNNDMVFDFLDIKPVVREVCNELDHKFLYPTKNTHLKVEETEKELTLYTQDGARFVFPMTDVLKLPIENTSAERIGIFLLQEIRKRVLERFGFEFSELTLEVEETPGQCAVVSIKKERL